MDNKLSIFLVDDDAVFLKKLEIEFLQHADFNIKTFATGEKCIEHLYLNPDVIILDYLLNGIDINAMNGIDALDKIKLVHPEIPVVMLSAQDKIDVAIDCMHHKAYDYVVKSETAFFRLQNIIKTLMSNQKRDKTLNWYMDRM